MSKVHPLAIIGGLLGLVFVANVIFVYIAITQPDAVVESYRTTDR